MAALATPSYDTAPHLTGPPAALAELSGFGANATTTPATLNQPHQLKVGQGIVEDLVAMAKTIEQPRTTVYGPQSQIQTKLPTQGAKLLAESVAAALAAHARCTLTAGSYERDVLEGQKWERGLVVTGERRSKYIKHPRGDHPHRDKGSGEGGLNEDALEVFVVVPTSPSGLVVPTRTAAWGIPSGAPEYNEGGKCEPITRLHMFGEMKGVSVQIMRGKAEGVMFANDCHASPHLSAMKLTDAQHPGTLVRLWYFKSPHKYHDANSKRFEEVLAPRYGVNHWLTDAAC